MFAFVFLECGVEESGRWAAEGKRLSSTPPTGQARLSLLCPSFRFVDRAVGVKLNFVSRW